MTATTRTLVPSTNMKLAELFRWGYQQRSDISFMTNVIQTSGCNRKAKMAGMWRLVASGFEVSSAPFHIDIDCVTVEGAILPMSWLEQYA